MLQGEELLMLLVRKQVLKFRRLFQSSTYFFYLLGMIYSSKDIYNQVMKLKKTMADGGHLEKYLMEIRLEGGTVDWHKSETGEILALWIQTKTMLSDVQKTKPWLFQTDTTFSTNRFNYILI